MPVHYDIEIAPTGYQSLRTIKNRRHRRELINVIDGLDRTPKRQGKALMGPLEGVLSMRAVRDRFRILYRVDAKKRLVSALLVGQRAPGQEADVYALAQKLLATFLRRRGQDG